jgi:hypothetical protein
MTTCDQVAERVVLGEPLGDFAEHAESCARCKRLVALPVELAAAKRIADPGMGFSSRITAGAQHRLVVRRRQRIEMTAGLGVVAAAAVALVATRQPDEPRYVITPPAMKRDQAGMQPAKDQKDPWKQHEVDPDVRSLVHLAKNVERSSHVSANWGRIEKPLAPYRALLTVSDKGTEP